MWLCPSFRGAMPFFTNVTRKDLQMETKKTSNKPKIAPQGGLLSDGVVFTEKSQTTPNRAYSAGELLRRATNGTMPPIYQEAVPYDFDDIVNGKHVTYDYQEQFDCDPVPAFPQIEDIFAMRDQAQQALNNANMLIKKQLEAEKEKEQATVTTEPNNQ